MIVKGDIQAASVGAASTNTSMSSDLPKPQAVQEDTGKINSSASASAMR